MQQLPLACFLSLIRPPGISFEDGFLQILPVDKAKCPFVRDHSDITVRLYTRHNPVVYQELIVDDDESLFSSNIDFNDPTVLYFSAFLEQPDDGSGLSIREAYMLRGDTNFIIFDLSRLEAGPWYFTAAENTWYIGHFAARLIDYLVSRGLDLKKTHLVGHSLGAQSAGVAGAVIKSGRVSRITGLDPAFPLFDKLPMVQRLDPADADFVDVIHTDAGIFGFNRPMGHVDFYPNGGISPQPGCELEVVLHEKRLLNNCDDQPQTRGYYIFHLNTNNKSKLEGNIIQFFKHIDSLKQTNIDNRHTSNTERDTDETTQAIAKVNLKRYKAIKKDTKIKYYPKETTLKPSTVNKIQKVIFKKPVITTHISQDHADETQDNWNYKREKRISAVQSETGVNNLGNEPTRVNMRLAENKSSKLTIEEEKEVKTVEDFDEHAEINSEETTNIDSLTIEEEKKVKTTEDFDEHTELNAEESTDIDSLTTEEEKEAETAADFDKHIEINTEESTDTDSLTIEEEIEAKTADFIQNTEINGEESMNSDSDNTAVDIEATKTLKSTLKSTPQPTIDEFDVNIEDIVVNKTEEPSDIDSVATTVTNEATKTLNIVNEDFPSGNTKINEFYVNIEEIVVPADINSDNTAIEIEASKTNQFVPNVNIDDIAGNQTNKTIDAEKLTSININKPKEASIIDFVSDKSINAVTSEVTTEQSIITDSETNIRDIVAKTATDEPKHKTVKRQKRFISFFRKNSNDDENFLLKMLEFLVKNRKSVIPVVTVMREINTLVKSANGELNHSTREKNNYIGGVPPPLIPVTYDLEIGDSKGVAFVKRLLGLGVRGGKLKISGSRKKEHVEFIS